MVISPGFFMDGAAMKASLSFSMCRWFRGTIFFGAVLGICIFSAADARGATEFRDELISLNLENRPLSEVLNAITENTGHTFIISEEWLDYPVSVTVSDMPLHRVLKLIFANLNNAIIYKSDGSSKIMVYAESVSSTPSSAPQAGASVPETPSSQEMGPETEAPGPADQEDQTQDITEAGSEDKSEPGEEQTSQTDEQPEEKNEISAEETNEGQEEAAQESTENWSSGKIREKPINPDSV